MWLYMWMLLTLIGAQRQTHVLLSSVRFSFAVSFVMYLLFIIVNVWFDNTYACWWWSILSNRQKTYSRCLRLDQSQCESWHLCFYRVIWINWTLFIQFYLPDMLFLQGSEVIFKVALSLLGSHKPLILQHDNLESIVEFIKTTLPNLGLVQMEKTINQVIWLWMWTYMHTFACFVCQC